MAVNERPSTGLKPQGLPRALSKRSATDPFIVMDVMGDAMREAARRITAWLKTR